MREIKVSDFLKFEIKPFLYGVLLSRVVQTSNTEKEMFEIYTSFKSSKAVNQSDFDFVKYSEILKEKYNQVSGYHNWHVKSVSKTAMKLQFLITNNLEITLETFNDLVYKKLVQESWLHDSALNEEKKMFMRGYMETRGSIDISTPYFSQDYFYNNNAELKKIHLFTDRLDIPFTYLNFNPRELQNDFVTGKKERNTQFRINLHYYANIFGFINEYKALVYEKAYNTGSYRVQVGNVIYFNVDIPEKNDDVGFIKYFNFFSNNIYKQELTGKKIEKLRNRLGFSKENLNESNVSRNKKIVSIFDEVSPDQCGLCGTTKTYLRKATQRQAFEIHHMIPFHNGKEYDNIANLVKLCSTCHSSLKKGSSPKDKQIADIISILHKNPAIYEYTSSVLGNITDINELGKKIQSMLG